MRGCASRWHQDRWRHARSSDSTLWSDQSGRICKTPATVHEQLQDFEWLGRGFSRSGHRLGESECLLLSREEPKLPIGAKAASGPLRQSLPLSGHPKASIYHPTSVTCLFTNHGSVRWTMCTTDSMTGTSTSTPTTVASAAPERSPNMLMAVATANSKKLLAPIRAEGPATQCGTFSQRLRP